MIFLRIVLLGSTCSSNERAEGIGTGKDPILDIIFILSAPIASTIDDMISAAKVMALSTLKLLGYNF